MKNVELAIHEAELDTHTLDIIDYADNISVIFDKIDKKVASLSQYLKSDSLTDILATYNSIKANYPIIHDNILSYSQDLINLKRKAMVEGKEIIFNRIKKETEKFKDMERRVDINGS